MRLGTFRRLREMHTFLRRTEEDEGLASFLVPGSPFWRMVYTACGFARILKGFGLCRNVRWTNLPGTRELLCDVCEWPPVLVR